MYNKFMNMKELDKFYTNKETVKQVVKTCLTFFGSLKTKQVIEPSAGDGKFLDELRKLNLENEVIALDILPHNKNIIKMNFFDFYIKKSKENFVIGNPPFGKRSKLAIEFINHSFKFSDVICFILPVQFERYNTQKQLHQDLKLIYSEKLNRNSFLLENKPYDVNCVFQIWVNKNLKEFKKNKNLRLLKALDNKHSDFKLFIHNNTKETLKYFDKNKYQWNFAIHRQGYYDYNKKIQSETDLISNRQYLFIKLLSPESKSVFNNINFEKLAEKNTSVKGFSNTDVVAEYKKIKEILQRNKLL